MKQKRSIHSYLRPQAKARSFILQALYQWQLNPSHEGEIIADFLVYHRKKDFDRIYFKRVFKGILKHLDQLDALIAKHSKLPLDQLDPITLALLRIAVYELKYEKKLHHKVVILAALELANQFGPEKSPVYIDGTLNRIIGRRRG